jgi:putative pyruvate formate lyase activating enzyme
MHRQVGDLRLDPRGVARRGLLVRHLLLPAGLAGTREIVDFLAAEISPESYLNIMDQYRPCYQAHQVTDYPELRRRITPAEYQDAVRAAHEAGLARLDRREPRFV